MTASGWRPTPSNTASLAGLLAIVTLILAGVAYLVDAKPAARYVGAVVSVLCALNLGVLVWRLDHTVSGIRRGQIGKQLGITLQITLWVVGVGAFIGSFWSSKPDWSLPLDEMRAPSMIVGILLGMATLLALIVTLTEVKKDEVPQAMTFREALDKAAAFVVKHGGDSLRIRMCAYYPNIGAVNRRDYIDAYNRFVAVLREYPVEAVGLRLAGKMPMDGTQVGLLADRVCCSRPANVVDAMGAFARMWDPKNDTELSTAKHMLEDAYEKCKNLIKDSMVGHVVLDANRPIKRWYETNRVPDYHFLVAFKEDDTPVRGFVLFGIRPAGMPIPKVRDETPPVVGMEVTDRTILRHLLRLWDDLRSHPESHPLPEETPAPVPPVETTDVASA